MFFSELCCLSNGLYHVDRFALLFGDPAEKFMVAVEKNDPAAINSLLGRREVTIDQVLKLYYTT